jgi:hypothetical protein
MGLENIKKHHQRQSEDAAPGLRGGGNQILEMGPIRSRDAIRLFFIDAETSAPE